MSPDDELPDRRPTRSLRIEIAPRTIALLLLVVGGVWIAFQLQAVIIVMIVALVMVGTLDPMVAWFERRRIGRGRALVLLFVAISLVAAGVLLLTVPPLISQLLGIITDAPSRRDQMIAWLAPYNLAKPFVQTLQAVPINDLVSRAGGTLVGYSSDILTLVGYAISTTFLAIYLLADPVRAKGLIYAVVPRQHHIKLARILIELKVIVGGYMRGQLITSVSISVFVFTLLTIYRVEDALAIALFAGITDVIPFIGGYISSIPVILAVTGSGTSAVIIVTIIMILYQEFESRLLVPRVYGKVLRLPPAVVLVALLVGGTLMGVFGALLSLPLAAGLQMLVRELRVELPGEIAQDPSTRARDEKAEHIYEQLTEHATAADAGVIASELAEKLKQTEAAGVGLTGEMPAIMAEIAQTLAEPTVPADIAALDPELEASRAAVLAELDAIPTPSRPEDDATPSARIGRQRAGR